MNWIQKQQNHVDLVEMNNIVYITESFFVNASLKINAQWKSFWKVLIWQEEGYLPVFFFLRENITSYRIKITGICYIFVGEKNHKYLTTRLLLIGCWKKRFLRFFGQFLLVLIFQIIFFFPISIFVKLSVVQSKDFSHLFIYSLCFCHSSLLFF